MVSVEGMGFPKARGVAITATFIAKILGSPDQQRT